jgi:hypothetical protein
MSRFAFAIFTLSLAGCSTANTCPDCQDSGIGSCQGVCGPSVPTEDNWYPTVAFWSGPVSAVPPACPSMQNDEKQMGFADTAPTVECPSCECGPSDGKCYLPSTMSASVEACPGTTNPQSFDASQLWDGTCTAMDAVSSAASVTVSPPYLLAEGCFPSLLGPPTITGMTQAEACSAPFLLAPGTCGDQSLPCIYPATEGFSACISSPLGDRACPAGWPDKHLFYDSGVACSCSCGPSVGDSCSAAVTVFSDGACSTPLGSVAVSTKSPAACVDVPAGSPLGSKSATPPIYTAGTCAASLVPSSVSTLCCLP